MTLLRYVLDTNIFAAILRNEPKTTQHVTEALVANAEFLMCPIVFYEVYRGLLYRDARKQLSFFLKYTLAFTWDDLNQDDWQKVAHLWADLRCQGIQVTDADLIIGAYTVQRNAILVTDNQQDFARLGVALENWR
jgi:predicted nucleic acid-binding protein